MFSEFLFLVNSSQFFWLGLMLFLGLMVGSFHTVVISRLPGMMFADWREQASEILGVAYHPEKVPTLIAPRSACVNCGGLVKWWMNVPLLSFLMLKGRCGYCGSSIGWQYPLTELVTASVTVAISWVFGPTPQALLIIAISWLLIPAVLIDIKHQLLPDSLVMTALWLALLGSVFNPLVTPASAIYGAAVVYLALYIIGWFYAQLRGAVGLGEGDMKLFAVFGALAGAEFAIIAILVASIVHIVLVATMRLREAQPFGPAILISAIGLMLFERLFGTLGRLIV